jgi:putative hydrolase of HD superfamily
MAKNKFQKTIQSYKLDPIILIYYKVQPLISLLRQGWINKGLEKDKCESVMEHIFKATLLSLLIANDRFPELNVERVVFMALTHDLGEVVIGDLVPSEITNIEDKHKREREAIKWILGEYSHSQFILELFDEFTAQKTNEAKFVRIIDKLDIVLQALPYHFDEGIDITEFYQAMPKYLNEDDGRIASIFQELQELKEKDSV